MRFVNDPEHSPQGLFYLLVLKPTFVESDSDSVQRLGADAHPFIVAFDLCVVLAVFLALDPLGPRFFFGQFAFGDGRLEPLRNLRFLNAPPNAPSFFFGHFTFGDSRFEPPGNLFFFDFMPLRPGLLFCQFACLHGRFEPLANCLNPIFNPFFNAGAVFFFVAVLLECGHHRTGLLQRKLSLAHGLPEPPFNGLVVLGIRHAKRKHDNRAQQDTRLQPT